MALLGRISGEKSKLFISVDLYLRHVLLLIDPFLHPEGGSGPRYLLVTLTHNHMTISLTRNLLAQIRILLMLYTNCYCWSEKTAIDPPTEPIILTDSISSSYYITCQSIIDPSINIPTKSILSDKSPSRSSDNQARMQCFSYKRPLIHTTLANSNHPCPITSQKVQHSRNRLPHQRLPPIVLAVRTHITR